MKLDFFKMQAQGNDYIFFDFSDNQTPDIDFPKLARKLSNRHFGIGGDGIVLIETRRDRDAKMRIFNADGSEGKMCGSALRCLVSYLARKQNKTKFEIETASGIKYGQVLNEAADEIKVNLGKAKFLQDEPIVVCGFEGYLVNIGNDHFVTFLEKLTPDLTRNYGAVIQADPHFADSINVNFVQLKNPEKIEIRFWERGSGETLACGTGAAASVFAGFHKFALSNHVKVTVPGGEVDAFLDGQNVFLSGKVDFVFRGSIDL